MAGRTKWSDIKGQITPERRERIAARTGELRALYPADETCAVASLRILRESQDTPMSELAAALRIDKAGVLAFEECDDAAISQLQAYITAIGARLKIVAEFPDKDEVIIANFYQKRRRAVSKE